MSIARAHKTNDKKKIIREYVVSEKLSEQHHYNSHANWIIQITFNPSTPNLKANFYECVTTVARIIWPSLNIFT